MIRYIIQTLLLFILFLYLERKENVSVAIGEQNQCQSPLSHRLSGVIENISSKEGLNYKLYITVQEPMLYACWINNSTLTLLYCPVNISRNTYFTK